MSPGPFFKKNVRIARMRTFHERIQAQGCLTVTVLCDLRPRSSTALTRCEPGSGCQTTEPPASEAPMKRSSANQ